MMKVSMHSTAICHTSAKLARSTLFALGMVMLSTQAWSYVPPGSGSAASTAPPVGPSQLTVTATSTTAVTLNWTDPDDSGISLYKLYRNGEYARSLSKDQITTTAGSTASKTFSETGLTAGATYKYTITVCYSESLCSPQSNEATVTLTSSSTPTTAPGTATATATGTITSQTTTASIDPAGNAGKQGSVFVAAVLPTHLGGGVFFMNSTNGFVQFTGCSAAPAYTTGTLTAVSEIKVTQAMDLSSLLGTDIYVGYGLGDALSPAGTACTNMLNNGTYFKAYTIK